MTGWAGVHSQSATRFSTLRISVLVVACQSTERPLMHSRNSNHDLTTTRTSNVYFRFSHDEPRHDSAWVEDRGGEPATVASTSDRDDVGILRVWFPGQGSGDRLQEIGWEEFFAKFDEANLAFLYDIRTNDGDLSRFCKFVAR